MSELGNVLAPDPDDDVDNDDNGDMTPSGAVVSGPVTLSAGDEPGTDAVDNPTRGHAHASDG